MLKIEMRIDLRRGNAGVTAQFLHRPQIAGRLQYGRGERMAQHVRMDVARQSGTGKPEPCSLRDIE